MQRALTPVFAFLAVAALAGLVIALMGWAGATPPGMAAAGPVPTVTVTVLATPVANAADAGTGTGTGDGSSGAGGGAGAQNKRACVILPDTAASRWENIDGPQLKQGIEGAGFQVDIQNAKGNAGTYAGIAADQLRKGCSVMLLGPLGGASADAAAKARGKGIPVIAYDQPISGAKYTVAFDNTQVGRLQGQAIVDRLRSGGKDPSTATVYYMGGDPGNAKANAYRSGAIAVMSAAGIRPAAEPAGTADQGETRDRFEQALTAHGAVVDAVWAAGDGNAAGVITVLQGNGLIGVPVTGSGAGTQALQNVLLGTQAVTVQKPAKSVAKAAATLAVALMKGQKPSAGRKQGDGTWFVAVAPKLIGPAEVQSVVESGEARAADICIGAALQTKCGLYGVR